jgi:hypothetical protein
MKNRVAWLEASDAFVQLMLDDQPALFSVGGPFFFPALEGIEKLGPLPIIQKKHDVKRGVHRFLVSSPAFPVVEEDEEPPTLDCKFRRILREQQRECGVLESWELIPV